MTSVTNIKIAEVEGFDAADLDREIISSRLRQDVAEEQGDVYKFIADTLKPIDTINKKLEAGEKQSKVRFTHMKSYGVNSVDVHFPYAYTVTKDLYLAKWDISNVLAPKIVRYVKGNHRIAKDNEDFKGHRDEILSVAASPDGKHVVTGGKDKRLVVWTTENLSPVKVIHIRNGHKPLAVTGLVFRRGTNELYASCSDLIVRTFNINHMAQTETLFGHQDLVADISALGTERCLTVGSRDRTAMLWKISEESRLTFRGGDSEKVIKQILQENKTGTDPADRTPIIEGSIDTCSLIDDSHFITGSDNGNISLWSLQKKRPLFVVREAHGRDAPLTREQASAEASNVNVEIPPALPRGITALTALPFGDVFLSGSYDGTVKVWRLTAGLRGFELLGTVAVPTHNVTSDDGNSRRKHKKKHANFNVGVINKICIVETGSKGKETYAVLVAVSKEIKNGRWIKIKNGKNGLLSFALERK